ncbi:hypothetical protein M9Y10_006829 [Tritrichomonas musculus]|uniref:DUF3447 domain-containing protein n=1 Tax=Tritrichomonas musculus TaxID=1915356 RepID=A0ABR2JGF8_9EUKA
MLKTKCKESNDLKKHVDIFLLTNKIKYDSFSQLQSKLNDISNLSFADTIEFIKENQDSFFKDHATSIFFVRNIIRFSKINLKQMELILDLFSHFSNELRNQNVTEAEIIDSCDKVLNIINYLFYIKVISIETIIQKSVSFDVLFINFLPEIEEYDKEYSNIRENKLMNDFNDDTNINHYESFYNMVKSDPKKHVRNRNLNYHPSSLHKSIRDDDIETFQSILSKNNYSVNHKIEYSIYERAHTPDTKMSLIQIAAIYGSLKVFKFLWLQKETVFDENIQRYANYGNNYEIIHLIELKGSHKYVIDDLIAFNRHDLLNYFLDNYGNEIENESEESLKNFVVDDDELSKSLNNQNLLCAITFFNIPIIVSCLHKIAFIVKNDESEISYSLIQRSEFDLDLLKFLLSLKSNDLTYGLYLFSYTIKTMAFDTFTFLFHKYLPKIDFYNLFHQCILVNSKFVNYLLDFLSSNENILRKNFLIFKAKISIDELLFAVDFYDEDTVVKMIKLFYIIDSYEKQNQFLEKLAENLSIMMISSLFKRIIPFLISDDLISILEVLKFYEISEICDLIVEKVSINNQ